MSGTMTEMELPIPTMTDTTAPMSSATLPMPDTTVDTVKADKKISESINCSKFMWGLAKDPCNGNGKCLNPDMGMNIPGEEERMLKGVDWCHCDPGYYGDACTLEGF